MASRRHKDEHYAKKVYDLPGTEMENLCSVLDENESWKELGRKCLESADLEKIARDAAIMRNTSPTEQLIIRMGSLDYSIKRLFLCLFHLKNFKAMVTIKSFVNPKLHFLMTADLTPRDRRHEENGELSTSSTSSESTMLRHITSYPCEKLQSAIRNLTMSEELGRGGFGVVLKTRMDGTDYAVKLLMPKKKDERAELRVIKPCEMWRRLTRELKYSNMCRHDNILPLYGWSVCKEKGIYASIYQFMAHNSLHNFLHEEKCEFRWKSKVKIAKEIARGLRFLHSTMSPPVVHGDIKSANILLDQNFCPKIGDFGLARQLPNNHRCPYILTRNYRGTRCYSPPEYRPSEVPGEIFRVSTKVDVYAFGVVLYEIITGLRPETLDEIITGSDHKSKEIYKRLEISRIRMSMNELNDCQLLTSVAELCIQKERISLEEMVAVFPRFGENTETTISESDEPGSAPSSENSWTDLEASVSDEDDQNSETDEDESKSDETDENESESAETDD